MFVYIRDGVSVERMGVKVRYGVFVYRMRC